jgi:hypothetical protein
LRLAGPGAATIYGAVKLAKGKMIAVAEILPNRHLRLARVAVGAAHHYQWRTHFTKGRTTVEFLLGSRLLKKVAVVVA